MMLRDTKVNLAKFKTTTPLIFGMAIGTLAQWSNNFVVWPVAVLICVWGWVIWVALYGEAVEREIKRRLPHVECLTRAESALKFYAKDESWMTYDAAGPEDPRDLVCPVAEDTGDTARQALREINRIKGGV